MALVVDVSIAVKWFLPDEQSNSANALLDRIVREGAYVLALFRWEIESVLLGAERPNRIDPDEVDAALESLRDLPIALELAGERFFSGNEVRLALHYDLTPYDAAYSCIAASRNIPLATTDHSLAYAARPWNRRFALIAGVLPRRASTVFGYLVARAVLLTAPCIDRALHRKAAVTADGRFAPTCRRSSPWDRVETRLPTLKE